MLEQLLKHVFMASETKCVKFLMNYDNRRTIQDALDELEKDVKHGWLRRYVVRVNKEKRTYYTIGTVRRLK